jgi:DNA helicase-2/ATP-dependent DNA helicase PcrA
MLDLTRNHRSTALIITVANTLLEEGAVGITPAREEGDMPLVRAYDTDEEEATHVASWLRSRFQPGSPWKSMAVLARTNAQLTAIETALTAAAIPVERRGAEHSPASDIIGESPARWTQPEIPNAVALSTIHRAKGLEWQHVAVVGWADGVLPSFQAHSVSQLAEEQRLAYVALTRAESTLLLTWSRGTQDPRRPPRTASPFLGPILAAIAAETARLSPLPAEQVTERIASMKAKLRAALDAHENEV